MSAPHDSRAGGYPAKNYGGYPPTPPAGGYQAPDRHGRPDGSGGPRPGPQDARGGYADGSGSYQGSYQGGRSGYPARSSGFGGGFRGFGEPEPQVAQPGAGGYSDEALLHRLGYAQVLYREMGGFSNFAISFTIISILSGCLNSYYIAFNNGGPVAVTWGWLLVGVFCVLISLSMGEIASAMPTAGALYFWASKLGGPAWGWFTGWFNLIGQIAVTAAIDYGGAVFTTALLRIYWPEVFPSTTRSSLSPSSRSSSGCTWA